MKKLIALLLSIFTILLVSTSAFAFSGGGISGGVNGDGDFDGGGFTGGSRLSSVFGSSPPASSSLSTMLSYEALNNLTANINLGISLGEIEILDGNIQAVTVTKRTDWNAYVITGVYNGNTYVIVNASGGRYYSPINDGYAVSAIAGVSTYFITPRPVGTVGNNYLGDFCISRDNYNTLKSTLNNLGGATSYYTILFSVDGEIRYYLATAFGGTRYFVCNSAGQLYYALKDEPEDVSGTTDGTFDATEVITAINSVYNKLDSGFEVVTKGINETNNRITSLNDDFILHMNNTVSGLSAANGTLNTIADYLSGLMNKQIIERSITYSGTDVFIDWDTSRTVVDVVTADIEDDIYVKSAYGERQEGVEGTVSVSNGFELVTDENGYYRVVVTKDYPEHNPNPPVGTVLYYDFEDSSTDDMMLSPVIGDAPLTFSYTVSTSSSEAVSGEQCVHFWDADYDYPITGSYSAGLCNAENNAFSVSLWYKPQMFPSTGYYQFRFGTSKYFSLQVTSAGILRATYYATSAAAATTTATTEATLSTGEWNHIAACYDGATLYLFLNGELCYEKTTAVYPPKGGDFRFSTTSSSAENMGCYMDDFLWVDGSAIWTSAFNPYESAVFSRITDDYYLSAGWPSYYHTYTDDEGNVWGEQNQPLCSFSPTTSTDDDYVPTSMGRLCDDVSYIYFDIYSGKWKLYDCLSKREFNYVGSNFNENFMFPVDNYTTHSPDMFTVATFDDYVVGSPVWLDIPDGGTITVTYLEYVNWFDSIYSLIDMQSDQLTAIVQKMGNATGDTIINIENTVVDITQDNDAYNVFYIENADGTTESVGNAAKDAAVFVGDVLSMFYRLVFDDALDNVGILKDFEGAYSNTEVSVW